MMDAWKIGQLFIVCLTLEFHMVFTSFVAIVEHKDLVLGDSSVTAGEGVGYLTTTNGILSADIATNDPFLDSSLVEALHIITYIADQTEEAKYKVNEVLNITEGVVMASSLIISGVNKLACFQHTDEGCFINFYMALYLVEEAQNVIMRLSSLLVEFPGYESSEVVSGGITVSCLKTLVKYVVQGNIILGHLGIPPTPENVADPKIQNTVVKLFVFYFEQNPYAFVYGPYTFNVGVVRNFMLDNKGEYVDLVSEINIYIDAAPALAHPYYDNVSKNSSDNSADLEVTFDSDEDSGVLSIQMSSVQKCTTFTSSDSFSFIVVTSGVDVILNDTSPADISTSFSNQTLHLLLTSQTEALDVKVFCEDCMQMADIVFILDDSGSVNDEGFLLSVMFISTLVEKINVSPSHVRIGLMTFSTEATTVFHLNSYVDKQDVLDAIKAVGNGTRAKLMTHTHNALAMARMNMLFVDQRDVQKLVFVITDGISFDRNATVVEAENLKNLGVDMIAVGVGIGVNDEELSNIAGEPKEFRIFKANNFSLLDDLAGNLIEVVCKGQWSNLTSPKGELGRISSFVLDESSGEWQRSTGLQLSAYENEKFKFKSNFFGTFGFNIFAIEPETIDFEEVLNNIDEKIADSPAVLATNIALLCLLAVGTVILRRKDMQDEKRWLYRPLCDNPISPCNTYFISVHTGLWSTSQLRTIPYITLKGWYGDTGPRPLIDKAGMINSLQRWKFANFALGTNDDIGPLEEIRIWHDGEDPSCRWYLDKVLITDGESGNKYVFLCDDWLAADRGDGKTYRQLYCAHSSLQSGKVLFTSLTRFKLFDDYLWLSIFSRPAFSRFSRVQRLYCVSTLLSLSMLASAMWFTTDKGTTTYGLTLGPVKINYKQFFVGIMSIFITFPPLFILSVLFRNRRFRPSYGKNCTDYTFRIPNVKDGIFPWPTVFLGYGLAGAGIASGGVLTFFYSLQWGNEISGDWLMSLFLGTTNGIVIVEPLKVVFLSVVIACVFKGLAKNDIMEMAPYVVEDAYISIELTSIPHSRWPGGMETSELEKLRKRLLLDRKLLTHLRVIFTHAAFIGLLACICSHNYVTTSYLQNDGLIQQLKPKSMINRTEDVWTWLKDIYFPNIFPKRFYNGQLRLPPERKLLSDGCSYRMGPVRLRQIRVKGNCTIVAPMDEVFEECVTGLKDETKDTTAYCPGWTPYTGTCGNNGYAYTEANMSSAFPFFGVFHTYGGEGYMKDMNPFRVDVYHELDTLQAGNWIDTRTRFIVVEVVVMNINSKLFSLVSFRFEIPDSTGIFASVQVQTSRLYPYVNTWDYIILGLQCLFILITLLRLVYFLYEVWQMKLRIFLDVYSLGTLLSIITSITAIGSYIGRVDRTIYIVEEIFNSTGEFVSFEIVQLLDDIYKGCIGVVLFVAILQLLKPLSFNYYIYLMKSSIAVSKQDLMSFGVVLTIPMAAFASLTYCFLGSHSFAFRTFPSSLFTLIRTMLAMVKFKDTFGSDGAVNNFIFTLFIFIMSIVLINVFVSILNDSFAHIRENIDGLGKVEPFDKDLNQHFWYKVGQMFSLCKSGKNDDSTSPERNPNDNRKSFDQNMSQLDQMVEEIIKALRQSNRS